MADEVIKTKQPDTQFCGTPEDSSLAESQLTSASQDEGQLPGFPAWRIAQWIALILGCLVSLLKIITTFIELWRGNRGAATWTIAAFCLTVLIGVPLWLAFSRKPVRRDVSSRKMKHAPKVWSWRFPRLRKLALVLLALALVGAFFSGAALYREHSARRGKVVALVAGFDGPDSQKYMIGEQLALSLSKSLGPYPDGIVRSLGEVVTREQGSTSARALAARYHADMVMWGWYEIKGQEVEVTVHVEMMTQYQTSPLPPTGPYSVRGSVAQLRDFEIQQRLSEEMTVLAFLTKGLMAYDRGDYQLAVLYLTLALGQKDWGALPASKRDAFFCRGTSYIYLRDLERAVVDLSRSIEIDPLYEQAYYNRGYASDELAGQANGATRKARYAEALKDYSKAIELDATDKEAYNNRGVAYTELDEKGKPAKDLLKAVEDLSTAINLDPHYDLAYYNRARARSQSGETTAAVADLTQAIAINPKFAEAYSERGLIRLNSTIPTVEESIDDFSQAIQANPTLGVAYYNRGIAYKELGRKEMAVADLRVALALGEADAEADLRGLGVDPKAGR